MEIGTVKIVGVVKREKDGKVSYTIHGVTPFEDWESENSIGMKVVSEWTNRVDCSHLKPGDIVQLFYTKGYQGSAVLNNIILVEKSK